jgi:hypothetical protein
MSMLCVIELAVGARVGDVVGDRVQRGVDGADTGESDLEAHGRSLKIS